MTRAPAAYRYMLCVILVLAVAACRRPTGEIQVVDLIREFDRAEKRPPEGSQVTTYSAGGVDRPSLLVPAPSRVIWPLPLPQRGRFRAFAALDGRGNPAAAIRLRVGISDHRIYEGLAQQTITAAQPGWVAVGADLSAYAGFKWSLFYRPDRVTWRLVLSADLIEGGGAAVWGSPEIVTDAPAAKEYVTRRQHAR